MENVVEWINNNGSSYGSGSGRGSGYGSGRGSGYGSGSGSGSGYGSGSGSGSGRGSGYGYGSGSGRGSGSSYGSGSGRGSGSSYGLKMFDDQTIYLIDNIKTIITHIRDSFAKGFILDSDFTLTPCYIAKGNGYFAHGKTIKEAREALRSKVFENMDTDEAIREFTKTFDKNEKYPGTKFFEWHHHLTGSCLMGRESFVRNHGLDLESMYTVNEFIDICENDYGGEIIKKLKEFYE